MDLSEWSYYTWHVLCIGSTLVGREDNHVVDVVERIWFHSGEYSWCHYTHDISRGVAGDTAARGFPEWPLAHDWPLPPLPRVTARSTAQYDSRWLLTH